jgi:hypothetical protein
MELWYYFCCLRQKLLWKENMNISYTNKPKTRDAPDIRPANPAFFYIRYPAGYRIALPDTGIR